jgi:hypothetical protein
MLQQIDTELLVYLQRAEDFLQKDRIVSPNSNFEHLWDQYNVLVARLNGIDPVFFSDVPTCEKPKPIPDTLWAKTGLSIYEGASLIPIVDGLKIMQGYLSTYKNQELIDPTPLELAPISTLNQICSRVRRISNQLLKRHGNRLPLKLNDEYDLQYLFHALLHLFFDDIRPEEVVPAHAGKSSRIDFILSREKIAIELKFTRKNLTDKEIGEQLIIDIARYSRHPDVDKLYCFVYDPDARIKNPHGIENDLTKTHDDLEVFVFIDPK